MPSSPTCLRLSCPTRSAGLVKPCGVYPSSSMSDAQWAVTEPLLPPPTSARGRGGRPPKHPRRGGPGYNLLRGPGRGNQLAGFPPATTVYDVFRGWVADGIWIGIHDVLHDQVRLAAGRRPLPTAPVIDSQSVRGADTMPGSSRGYVLCMHDIDQRVAP